MESSEEGKAGGKIARGVFSCWLFFFFWHDERRKVMWPARQLEESCALAFVLILAGAKKETFIPIRLNLIALTICPQLN